MKLSVKLFIIALFATLSFIPVKATVSLVADSTVIEEAEINTIDIPDDSLTVKDADRGIVKENSGENDEESRNWWQLLKQGKLNLADRNVEYPKFLGFCVKVYNWADTTFNSYDTDYVIGTGRRWKARLLSDNWVDSYAINMGKDMPIRIMSDIYCNAGGYIQYMAVSVGYTIDLSNVIGNKPQNHKKLEFGFNCARFNVEMHYWENTGGSYLRKFGNYRNGGLFKHEIPSLYLKTFDISGYYFFNNRKYSQGAAYNFSKFQKKSAGSFIIGATYSNLDFTLDLAKLPYKLHPFATIPLQEYRIHYRSYAIMSGYGYNWVLNPHLLFNISVFPEIGLTRCYEDSYQAKSTLTALNFRGRSSLTYNCGDFFLCLIGKIDGNWYKSGNMSFFSSIENLSFNAGVRF